MIYLKSDRYGTLTPFKVDTTYVGALICTKAVGGWGMEDITHNYKYPEGNVDSPYDKTNNTNTEDQVPAKQFNDLCLQAVTRTPGPWRGLRG